MILELAMITVRPTAEAAFEQAFPAAVSLISASPGYVSHELRRSIEAPNRYALSIRWRSLEDHTVGFRGSPAFGEWRAQLAPFLQGPPVVEHFQPG
jgi:heme-degrading monooxygenase HmoA